MARMINAEVLAKAFAEFLAKSYFGLLRTPTWDDAMDVFCEAPKVDAVEVVRCKDCKWYSGIEDEEGNVYPTCEHPEEGGGWTSGKDWFCADGEPKEDNDGKVY